MNMLMFIKDQSKKILEEALFSMEQLYNFCTWVNLVA